MKIREAIDIMGRSRHAGIFIECLEHKDGLSYKELYAEYCKRCKDKCFKPIAFDSIYAIIRIEVAKGFVRRGVGNADGHSNAKRLWLVK